MSHYLDPKIDLVFNKVFGEHAHLFVSFLNAVLPLGEGCLITDLRYLKPKPIPLDLFIKGSSIIEAECTDQQGKIFIVQVQMVWQAAFKEQVMFGAAQAFAKQEMPEFFYYEDLKPLYSLAIINKEIGSEIEDWYHDFAICSKEAPDSVLFDTFRMVLVELPKFKVEGAAHKKLLVLWMRFLKEIEMAAEDLKQEPLLSEALQLAELSTYTPAELASYEQAVALIAREASALKKAGEGARS